MAKTSSTHVKTTSKRVVPPPPTHTLLLAWLKLFLPPPLFHRGKTSLATPFRFVAPLPVISDQSLNVCNIMISLLHLEKIVNGRLTRIVLTVVLLTVTFGPFSRFSSKITYTSGRGYPRTYKTKYTPSIGSHPPIYAVYGNHRNESIEKTCDVKRTGRDPSTYVYVCTCTCISTTETGIKLGMYMCWDSQR